MRKHPKSRVWRRWIGKWQKVRRYEGARGSVCHCYIHDEEAAGAIIAIKNADIGTALSGGLIGCIALAQVPNDGHRRYSRWMSSMFAMSSLSSDFTSIASAPEGAGGGSGAGADERLVVKNV